MSDILRVSGLTKNFGNKKAVDNISFEVSQGSIMGLLGPNGAGKTTAIRLIMGIINPDNGNILFNFNGKTTSMDKSRIGYLPEERGLYDDATVLDNLVYLADLKDVPRKKARQKALAWLKKMELLDYARHKLEKLSKGMQQKVQFIATVLHQPDLVMLDEPFSGLDPINQDLFKSYIKELQKRGTTILLSAHQMNLVEELCEHIFMINRGKQVLYGSLGEIKKEHQEYLIEIRFSSGDFSFLTGENHIEVLSRGSEKLSLRYTGTRSVQQLLNDISAQAELEEISINKPPLHDIFVRTVQKRGDTIEDPAYL